MGTALIYHLRDLPDKDKETWGLYTDSINYLFFHVDNQGLVGIPYCLILGSKAYLPLPQVLQESLFRGRSTSLSRLPAVVKNIRSSIC